MKKNRMVSYVLAAALFVGSCAPITVQAATIESAKKKAEQLEREKAKAQKEQSSLSAQLNKIIEDLKKAQSDVEAKEKEIAETEDELTAARIKENEQYEAMKIRIKYMYENGDSDMIAVLLSAENMADFLNKAEYVEQISIYDREMLVEFQRVVKEIEEKEAKLKKEKEELLTLQDNLSKKQKEVESLLASKNAQISDLESQIGENAKVLNALIEAAKEAERRRQEAEEAAKQEAENNKRPSGGNSSSGSGSSGGNYKPGGNVISGNGTLSNPCPGARISSEFGPRRAPTAGASSYHRGRDYAAPSGTPIYASAAGTVITASYNGVRGNYVVIDHGNGLQTWYQHASRLYVSAGQKVSRGQNIAAVGTTGVSTGAHLHYEVHVNGAAVDPRRYL